ncbi:hypothetical protein [Quadrisphaera sp. KR29]|uniref:hypothetical protein n=1 Tax=Quadrisphaera sp. KR29 TaxID=3461391 RepID=UPI004044AF6D
MADPAPARPAGPWPRRAAVAAALVLGAVAAFQVAVAAGAPWGRWTQGGGTRGALGASGRAVAVGSALLLVVMAGALLGRAGAGPVARAPRRAVGTLAWVTTCYAAVGVVLNAASRSVPERALWTPVTAVLLALSLVVVLGTRSPRPGQRPPADPGGGSAA